GERWPRQGRSKPIGGTPEQAQVRELRQERRARRMNSLTHGVSAKMVLLAGEDSAEFEIFRDRIWEDCDPEDALQEIVTVEIVSSAWQLRWTSKWTSAPLRTIAKLSDKNFCKTNPIEGFRGGNNGYHTTDSG